MECEVLSVQKDLVQYFPSNIINYASAKQWTGLTLTNTVILFMIRELVRQPVKVTWAFLPCYRVSIFKLRNAERRRSDKGTDRLSKRMTHLLSFATEL